MATRDVQEIYIAYYGRPADPEGLSYWNNRVSNEGGIAAIMQQFGTSKEFTDSFGGLGTNQLINSIYQRLFNRDADDEGLNFYANKLDSGQMSLQTIALNILSGVRDESADAALIAEKVTVAEEFTNIIADSNISNYQGQSGIAVGSGLIQTVGSAWTDHWTERANVIADISDEPFEDVYIQPDDLAAQFLARLDVADGVYSTDKINDLSPGIFGGGFLKQNETPVIQGRFQSGQDGPYDEESYVFVGLQPGNYRLNVSGDSVFTTSLFQLKPATGQYSPGAFRFLSEEGSTGFQTQEVMNLEVLISGEANNSDYTIELVGVDNPQPVPTITLQSSPSMNAAAYSAYFNLLF